MTADRRQRIEAVALEALARAAAERAAYLDAACADDADLRRDVGSLLAGQSEAAAMLESPPWAEPAEPLAPGTRLGPYEIESALGSGGMGEVYKARDRRLGRTVAIKVLPPQLASDPERRRRFEQEARHVSALKHPHICPLFDLGEAVVQNPESRTPSPDPIHYLVLAHLEGQTIAARLAKGPLTVAQVLDVGAQIADALSAAHKAGILHRDLKPANVMLTKGDGGGEGRSGLHAMLLDFGLAKLAGLGEQPAIAFDSASGEGRGPITAHGTVLGTAPYMAPEQIEGKPADARADIWALGAVLYEMLTGRRAFEGDTPTMVAVAILKHEPATLTSLQPGVPPALVRLITKCLAKDPDARWDTAHDVADELRWMAQTSGTVVLTTVQPPRRRVARLALVVAGGLAMGAAGAGLMWMLRQDTADGLLMRPSLDVRPAEELNAGGFSPASVSTPGGSRTAFAWTPDGQALVFVGRRSGVQQLYVRRIDASEARPLAGTEDAQVPAVSQDGRWVAFWAGGEVRTIRKVPLGGGPAMDLAPGVTGPPWGMAWDAAGGLFYGWRGGGIWRIPPDGSPAAVTTVGDSGLIHALPRPLRDGGVLLYTVRKRVWSWGDEEIVAHTLATGARKVLLTDAADARYLPTGHLVFLRRGTLFAVPFDADRLKVRGPAVAVLDAVAQALSAGHSLDVTGAGQFDVAPTGTLAWIHAPIAPDRESELVAVDRRGQPARLPGRVRTYGPRVRRSPDGRLLAVTVRSRSGADLWIHDLDRGSSRLLAGGGEAMLSAWFPDGRRLAFLWLKDGRKSLAMQPADGTAPPRALLERSPDLSSWTPDGRHLAALQGGDIVVVSLDDGKASVRPLFETPHTERWPEFSPDGRWLAYGSNVSGRDEVYVRPYPGPGPAEQVSIEGGESPAWNPSGKELFFLSPTDAVGKRSMMAVDIAATPSLRIATPKVLFEFVPTTLTLACRPLRCYDVALDGQRFFATRRVPTPPVAPVTYINLIPNWVEELKAKVPAR